MYVYKVNICTYIHILILCNTNILLQIAKKIAYAREKWSKHFGSNFVCVRVCAGTFNVIKKGCCRYSVTEKYHSQLWWALQLNRIRNTKTVKRAQKIVLEKGKGKKIVNYVKIAPHMEPGLKNTNQRLKVCYQNRKHDVHTRKRLLCKPHTYTHSASYSLTCLLVSHILFCCCCFFIYFFYTRHPVPHPQSQLFSCVAVIPLLQQIQTSCLVHIHTNNSNIYRYSCRAYNQYRRIWAYACSSLPSYAYSCPYEWTARVRTYIQSHQHKCILPKYKLHLQFVK